MDGLTALKQSSLIWQFNLVFHQTHQSSVPFSHLSRPTSAGSQQWLLLSKSRMDFEEDSRYLCTTVVDERRVHFSVFLILECYPCPKAEQNDSLFSSQCAGVYELPAWGDVSGAKPQALRWCAPLEIVSRMFVHTLVIKASCREEPISWQLQLADRLETFRAQNVQRSACPGEGVCV